mgnify:FL=1
MTRSYLCSFLLLLLLGQLFSSPLQASADEIMNDRLIKRTLGIINRHYWRRPIAREELVEGAIKGILRKLNEMEKPKKGSSLAKKTKKKVKLEDLPWEERRAFNTLLAPADYKMMRQELSGGFSGIGAVIKTDEVTGYVLVQKALKGAPSRDAGIKDGDLITAVNGKVIKDLELKDIVRLLRGPTGSTVRLLIKRGEEMLNFSFARGPVVIPNVDHRILDKGMGYLRVRAFNRRTAMACRDAVTNLKRLGAKKLVFDLRDNPGGRLDAACDVSDIFLPKRTAIVSTQSEGKTPLVKRAKKRALWQGPILCLINGSTASGAEIVAGALREARVALLAGQATFGKDSVQTVFRLPRDYALKLSTTKLILRGPLDGPFLKPDVLLPEKKDDKRKIHLDVEEIDQDPWVKSAQAMLRFR